MEKQLEPMLCKHFFSTLTVESFDVFHSPNVAGFLRVIFPQLFFHFPQPRWITLTQGRNHSLLLIFAVISRRLSRVSLSFLAIRDSTFCRELMTVVWSRPNSRPMVL